jgi:hypothetical protein
VDEPDGYARLDRDLTATGADLLVLDSWRRLRSGQVPALVAALDRLIEAHGVTVVVTQGLGGEGNALVDSADRLLDLERDGDTWALDIGQPGNPNAVAREILCRPRDSLLFMPVGTSLPGAARREPPKSQPAPASARA